jgi:hypothetical protein
MLPGYFEFGESCEKKYFESDMGIKLGKGHFFSPTEFN